MKRVIILMGFVLGLNANVAAHMKGENVAPLGGSSSEEMMQAIRDGAKSFCEDLDDDQRELCVVDFYTQHDLEEEPSCD
jgi:hypothetical protein